MGHIEGEARGQATLFPGTLDEYISADNPVRFIDAFVKGLDLKQLQFRRVEAAETGRPGYHPADLLRLYIYGYLNRIRTSRRLEQETGRNLELLWLLGKLPPDFKTIADFRAQHSEALIAVCQQFVVLCRQWELFGGELVAVDGSKFRASNSRQRTFTRDQVQRELERTERKLREYLAELDANDRREASLPVTPRLSAQELQEKIARLKERQQKYAAVQQQLEQQGTTQLSLSDPDARLMRQSSAQGGGSVVAYNVQSVVDAKHKLIVAHAVTQQGNDQQQLEPMALAAKAALQVAQLEVVADQGYYDADQVAACEAAAIAPYISRPQTSKNRKRGLFTKRDFVYDPQADRYRCPAGEWLTYRHDGTDKARALKYYLTEACAGCGMRERCTRAQAGRRISRLANEEVLERMAARVAAHPDKLKRRQALVEHPFGTLKRAWHHGHFLTRGLSKVKAEISLSVLAYNLRRALNILGIHPLIAALA
jgi:transposase